MNDIIVHHYLALAYCVSVFIVIAVGFTFFLAEIVSHIILQFVLLLWG